MRMTNEEAYDELDGLSAYVEHAFSKESGDRAFDAIVIGRDSILENDKLKAEIEEFKKAMVTWNRANNKLLEDIRQLKKRLEIKDNNFELYSNALDEIEQLKTELEQSVKLPCKVGDTVTAKVNRPYNGNEATINGTITDIQIVVRVIHSFDRHIDFLLSDFGNTVFLNEGGEQK